MNEEALKEADKRAKSRAVFNVPENPRPGRLRGRLKGEQPHYGISLMRPVYKEYKTTKTETHY